jgi:calcineurin-like phosphoesterase family protein
MITYNGITYENVYFTSDTHFGHENIIKYCFRGEASREERIAEFEPFKELGRDQSYDAWWKASKLRFRSTEHMNDVLIERWNSIVKPGDLVIHNGDFFMGSRAKWKSIFDRLNGDIILVTGNHDKYEDGNERAGEIKDEIFDMGFVDVIENDLYIEVDGYKLWCAHIPSSIAPDKRGYMRPEPTQEFDINLCGHVHDKFTRNSSGSINVGCDMHEFYPRTIEEIIERARATPIFDSSIYLSV